MFIIIFWIYSFSEEQLLDKIDDSELQVENETHVYEFVIRWMKAQKEFHLERILSTIRWCSVPKKYITSKLLRESVIRRHPEGVAFLQKVIKYKKSRTEFTGLNSTIRSSEGHEKCLVFIGANTTKGQAMMSAVSLQRSDCPVLILQPKSIPTRIFGAASVLSYICHHGGVFHRSILFLTGLGKCRNEKWYRVYRVELDNQIVGGSWEVPGLLWNGYVHDVRCSHRSGHDWWQSMVSAVSLHRCDCPVLTHLQQKSIPIGMAYGPANVHTYICHQGGVFHRSILFVTILGNFRNEIWKINCDRMQ